MTMPASLRAAFLAMPLLAGHAAADGELPVDLELVLAIDVSGSIDEVEAGQQREGYVAALQDEAVLQAIRANPLGRIAVAYVEWAGADYQRVVVDWALIDGRAAAQGFVAALGRAQPASARWTSISGALDFAVPLFDGNGYAGARRAIDVSGDGPNNRGRPVRLARDAAVARGIVINGLPILDDRPQPFGMPTPRELELDRYYT